MPSDDVLTNWSIPCNGEQPSLEVAAQQGRITVVVGANGAGKSALSHWLGQTAGSGAHVHRVLAHRKVWFEGAGPNITSGGRQQIEGNLGHFSSLNTSRYVDHVGDQRSQIVLFDLLGSINDRNQQVAVLAANASSIEQLHNRMPISPLDLINSIFRAATIPIEVLLRDGSQFSARRVDSSAEYSIHEMSDGEKSALLLSAEVLTVRQNSIIIIDEPERHLHRSISASLIEAIISQRPDCHFVIMTHDLDFVLGLPASATTVLSVIGATWSGSAVSGWDIQEVQISSHVPDHVRGALLGGRRKVIFMEGDPLSLDTRLFRLLFDDSTLSPVGSCDRVIRAVTGVKAAAGIHWVDATGIVDSDARTNEEVAALAKKRVLVLPVSEVENVYYCRVLREAVGRKQANTLELDSAQLLLAAEEAGLASLSATNDHAKLAADIAKKIVHRQVAADLPSSDEIIASNGSDIERTIKSPYQAIVTQISRLVASSDLDGLLRILPVRDTGFRARVAMALHFKSTADYEAAARTCIRDDPSLRIAIKAYIGDPSAPEGGVALSDSTGAS